MTTLQRCWRAALITLCCAGLVAPAQAVEPLTLFVLKMLRDQLATAAIESAVNSATSRPPAQSRLPALEGVHGVSEAQLRGLIDTGFVHLSPAQRNEVYASLVRMLSDPRNAQARPVIIEELARQASLARGAHERLAALSATEKRAIALDARAQFERLPQDERDQLLQVLRSGVAPMPRDLNDLILAELNAAALSRPRQP
jgi:hypothetical protein